MTRPLSIGANQVVRLEQAPAAGSQDVAMESSSNFSRSRSDPPRFLKAARRDEECELQDAATAQALVLAPPGQLELQLGGPAPLWQSQMLRATV